MKKEIFTELLGSVHGALAHAQDKQDPRTTTLPPKSLNGPAVKRVRQRCTRPRRCSRTS